MSNDPPIDQLALMARFGREQRLSLRDPKFAAAYAAFAQKKADEALGNDVLLHGQRTERMFEALIVSLGHFKLLKADDIGVVHPVGTYIAPDFRVILKDSKHWLIEVKNVHDAEPGRQHFRMRPQDLAKLKDYAAVMDCPLKFALYWSLWRVWTLIDSSELSAVGRKFGIDMFEAMKINELAALGDRFIGTTPPLKLRLIADQTKPNSIAENGEALFTIADTAMYCGGREIRNADEREIAWLFMLYGDWKVAGPRANVRGDKIESIDFEWSPEERANEGQGFEMIGSLSSMFSRYYATQTLTEEGVVQTETKLAPDWFAPLIASPNEKGDLPLWRFIMHPPSRSVT